MREVVKFDEQKYLAALRGQFLNSPCQARDLLLRPDDGFDGRALVRLVERALRVVQRHRVPVLPATLMIDQ